MRLCWHPGRLMQVHMLPCCGPVTVVRCPDCPAIEFGLMLVPELQTPREVEEEHGRAEP